MELTQLPTFVTAMGKGCVNEELENYAGVYAGAGTHEEGKRAIENADAVLWLGRCASDFNTGEFTMHIDENIVVDLQRFFVTIGGKKVEVKMLYLLEALVADFARHPYSSPWKVNWEPYPLIPQPTA